jgi:hypothetical protein
MATAMDSLIAWITGSPVDLKVKIFQVLGKCTWQFLFEDSSHSDFSQRYRGLPP